MARSGFLETLDPRARTALEASGMERRLESGRYLCLEGDPSHSLYVIRSGLMRVDRTTRDGRVALLALAGSGDLFGELGVLDGTPRSASAVVIEDMNVLAVPASALAGLYRTDPEILVAITTRIVVRLRELTDQLLESGQRSIVARIAARLVAYVDRTEHADTTGPFSLRMPISQRELAEWAGLSREGTGKALRFLREEGVLSTGRQRIDVHRIDLLRTIAHGGH